MLKMIAFLAAVAVLPVHGQERPAKRWLTSAREKFASTAGEMLVYRVPILDVQHQSRARSVIEGALALRPGIHPEGDSSADLFLDENRSLLIYRREPQPVRGAGRLHKAADFLPEARGFIQRLGIQESEYFIQQTYEHWKSSEFGADSLEDVTFQVRRTVEGHSVYGEGSHLVFTLGKEGVVNYCEFDWRELVPTDHKAILPPEYIEHVLLKRQQDFVSGVPGTRKVTGTSLDESGLCYKAERKGGDILCLPYYVVRMVVELNDSGVSKMIPAPLFVEASAPQ